MFRVYTISQSLKAYKEKGNTNAIKCKNVFAIFVCNDKNEILHSEFGINLNMCPSTSEYTAIKKAISFMLERGIMEYELYARSEKLNMITRTSSFSWLLEDNRTLVTEIREMIKGVKIHAKNLEILG